MSVRRLIFSMLFSLASTMVIQIPNANYSCPERNNSFVCYKNKCQFACLNCTWTCSQNKTSGNCSTCWGNLYCNGTVYNATWLNSTLICPHDDKDNSTDLRYLAYYLLASVALVSLVFGGVFFFINRPQPPAVVNARNSDEELTDVESIVDMDERFREFLGEKNPKEKYKIHRIRNNAAGESSCSHQSRRNQDPQQRNTQLRKKKVIDVFYRIPSSIRDDSAVITIHKSFEETVGENGVGESTDDKPEGVEEERQQTIAGKSETRLEDGPLEQIKTEISQPKHKKRTRVDCERESNKKDDE